MMSRLALLFLALVASSVQAFAPVSRVSPTLGGAVAGSSPIVVQQFQAAEPVHPSLQRQRRSVARVQTQGLFGLGVPEIAVILIAAAFLLGPQKLAELGKDAGKIAGELKEVPKEFQAGLQEGEEQAKAMKAKEIEPETEGKESKE